MMIKSAIVILISLISLNCTAVTLPSLATIKESRAVLTWPKDVDAVSYQVCYGLVSDLSECEAIDVGYVGEYRTPILPSGDYHFHTQVVKEGVQSEWVTALTTEGADFLTIVTQIRPVMSGVEVN